MCGRFSFATEWEEVLREFAIYTSQYTDRPRYNVAPGQLVTAIISGHGERRIGPLKWGLIPHFSKDARVGYKMINARAETLEEKPSYRQLLDRKRCLIPADGYYEWKREAGKSIPYRMVVRDRTLFAMAGLFDTWIDPEGNKISSCTIITTAASEWMTKIHERMPVILTKEAEKAWLSAEDFQYVKTLLRPYAVEKMKAYPVSPLVNNVKNDSPLCIREEMVP